MTHKPVLVKEVIEFLAVKSGGVYVDCTVGSGGHALAVLEKIGREGFLIGIDRDKEAIKRASVSLRGWEKQSVIVHGNYADISEIVRKNGFKNVDGIVMDLGVSSDQLEVPERGFSFMRNGPLDMRMDNSKGITAKDLVNNLTENELCTIIRKFGEEPRAGRVARFIEVERKKAPITTTHQLVDIVLKAVGGRRGRLHPATRTFQALRIEVNDEMGSLREGLSSCINLLKEGGRIAVISFHSLEDRIVKECFARHVGKWESLQAGGRRWNGDMPVLSLIRRKPFTALPEEVAKNPRSRSAKLRVAERTEGII